jgi:RNA polymerase sigma-70 factor (ECF subfamily)
MSFRGTDVRRDNPELEGVAPRHGVEPALPSPAAGVAGAVDADEAQLIRRAQNGEREALGILVRRYQRRVFGLGMRFFGNADDAEDLVQDTFVRAWRGLDRFDVSRPFLPWLLRIAANRALTEIATRKRRGGVELDENLVWDGPGADEDVARREMRVAVERALQELPDDQRMILLLRASDGLSYRDIAEALNIPIGTVMSRLSRAREAMRRKMNRQ